MFDKILVAVDFSTANQAAVATARHLADQSGGELILLHVIEMINDTTFDEERAFYQRLEERAQSGMRQLLGASPGLEARQEILYGRRAQEILGFAEQEECDLIVVSSHRTKGAGVGRGVTISQTIALLANCSVLLVR